MVAISPDIKPKAGGTRLITWETLTESDTAAAAEVPDYPDKTVTVTGTFGSATVVIQGSNDGTNWYTLSEIDGTALSFTVASETKTILENPLFVRASASGGSSQDVDIIIIAAK